MIDSSIKLYHTLIYESISKCNLTRRVPFGILKHMDNRSTIATQALALFAARGYDAVGVQDIVLAAGVTKPTLYHYFGSKRGLIEALMQEPFGRLYTLVESAAAYQGDLPEALRRVVRVLFAFARTEPQFYRVAISTWLALPANEAHQVVVPLYGKIQKRLEQLFLDAVGSHGNMRERHVQYAATLLGIVNTYIILSLNGYAELSDHVAQQVVQQYLYGIYS